MIRVMAFLFSATIFAFALTQDASALRRGGIHAGDLRGGSLQELIAEVFALVTIAATGRRRWEVGVTGTAADAGMDMQEGRIGRTARRRWLGLTTITQLTHTHI